MDIKERFIEFIGYKKLSKRKFQESIGVSNSYIQNISTGIGADVLKRIKVAYPELNTDWLIAGEGEMLKSNNQTVGDISNSNVSGVNVSGTDIHINPNAYDSLLKIVEANQKATEKFQEQIDRLITIIEKKYESDCR